MLPVPEPLENCSTNRSVLLSSPPHRHLGVSRAALRISATHPSMFHFVYSFTLIVVGFGEGIAINARLQSAMINYKFTIGFMTLIL